MSQETQHCVVQGSISNPIQHRAVVESRLHPEGVKSAQLENQALKERLHAVEEQNKVLSANKRHRKQDNTVSKDILAFEAELKICAKQYGLMINMFPPPAALLKVTLPNPVPPFNTAARYATTGLQEIATLAELYDTLPQHLHHLVPMNRFSHVFSKVLCAGHASELNKLRSAAGQIFNLPQHYFTISHTRDMEPEIRQLLGITGKASKSYPLLPPMFQGISLTALAKHYLGGAPPNAVKWGVTAVTPGAVAWAIITNICLLSPDQEFPQEGKGKTSDSAEDLQEEMCLARLGLAAEARDSEDMSDNEEGDKNASIDNVLAEATGTITIHEPDEVPVPPGPMISTTDTMTSALTVSSNSSLITGSSPCVYDGPVDETEVVVIEETNIQPVKTKSKAGRWPKKSAVLQEGDVIDSRPAAAPQRGHSKR
ncbi:hypothetical protein DFJ58DRAFT_843266 [Suillus subalutaceus]|uniref:uncharacterized protein n=1 Tax=Suillus subalutaceus TaxID=48586 RepID=UPI001B86E1BC|nr:uncharacterized protein DFJ58DRAFT_843266 [Suillus subalutaceus]KAG1847176.1 hypothetical protein DFJ58DRAFT_843266 [Suillus subalutaceus]